jgi:hypothetical protein
MMLRKAEDCPRNSFDGDLDGVRGINGGWLVILIEANEMAACATLPSGARWSAALHFDRILHLHLEHQMAAAAQIEAQLDVFSSCPSVR